MGVASLPLIVTILGSIAIIIRTLTATKFSCPAHRLVVKELDLPRLFEDTISFKLPDDALVDKILGLEPA